METLEERASLSVLAGLEPPASADLLRCTTHGQPGGDRSRFRGHAEPRAGCRRGVPDSAVVTILFANFDAANPGSGPSIVTFSGRRSGKADLGRGPGLVDRGTADFDRGKRLRRPGERPADPGRDGRIIVSAGITSWR